MRFRGHPAGVASPSWSATVLQQYRTDHERVEDVALVGPPDKIARDLAAWRETAVTTLLVQGDATAVQTLAPLLAAPTPG